METSLIKLSSEAQKKIIDSYFRHKHLLYVCRETGHTYETVVKIIRAHNIDYKRVPYRKYELNERFFETIDTEEKAYWLGFIAADGYVSENNGLVNISLSAIDKDHLSKFLKSIGSNKSIKIKNKQLGNKIYAYAMVNVSSVLMVKDLIKHGVIQKKSLVLKPTENIPKELVVHYIRGYFDGDGGISMHITKRKYGSLQTAISFTSTIEICRYIQEFFEKKGFYTVMDKRWKDETNNYTLLINGNFNVIQACKIMYKDATLCMKRKYDRWEEIKRDWSQKHPKNEYVIYKNDERNNWWYQFRCNSKAYRVYGFKTKQECFNACKEKMTTVGYERGLRKLMILNEECE